MIIMTLVSAILFFISAIVVVPAFAGVSEEGVSEEGVSEEGVSEEGVSEEGVSEEGVSEEVIITLDNAHFISLSPAPGNQVGMFVSYTIDDSSVEGKSINAVMKVYAPNGTLVKTSSYPAGFVAQNSGGKAELKTTLTDQSVKSVTANVMFTDFGKKNVISNQLTAKLNLTTMPTTTPTTTPPTTSEEIGEAEAEEETEEEEEESIGFDNPVFSAEDEDIDDDDAEDEEEEETEESDDEVGEDDDDESIP
jgi:hypothetical protein